MATMITSECINCGACEPECPNTAIYQGAVQGQASDGARRGRISDASFYIAPERGQAGHCFRCEGDYSVPFENFQAGVVFRCPFCLGSTVPTLSMVAEVREAIEGFYDKWANAFEAFHDKRRRVLDMFEEKQRQEHEQFEAT